MKFLLALSLLFSFNFCMAGDASMATAVSSLMSATAKDPTLIAGSETIKQAKPDAKQFLKGKKATAKLNKAIAEVRAKLKNGKAFSKKEIANMIDSGVFPAEKTPAATQEPSQDETATPSTLPEAQSPEKPQW